MTSSNQTLKAAKKARDDEFYTPCKMIEAELQNYPIDIFKGKSVFCNCDDPGEDKDDPRMSEFFRYFDLRFADFGLCKLVGTRYSGSSLFPGIRGAKAYYRTVTKDKNGNKHGHPRRDLRGDGGFESAECVKLLEECDMVVTNPPFSRFQEFIALLVKHKKKFAIIGNLNAVSQKEFFPLIQSGKVWLGAQSANRHGFMRPDGTEQKLGFAVWYTNLPHRRREKEKLDLVAEYKAEKYPRYDNHPDIIEVAEVKNIPSDYDGLMGVPITFLAQHNPEQFEIVDQTPPNLVDYYVGGRKKYRRLIVKHKGA